jgi:hypothetical protein
VPPLCPETTVTTTTRKRDGTGPAPGAGGQGNAMTNPFAAFAEQAISAPVKRRIAAADKRERRAAERTGLSSSWQRWRKERTARSSPGRTAPRRPNWSLSWPRWDRETRTRS